MLRQFAGLAGRQRCHQPVGAAIATAFSGFPTHSFCVASATHGPRADQPQRWFSDDDGGGGAPKYDADAEPITSFDPERAAYLHHGKRPRFRDRPKFKSPRKLASKLFGELNAKAVEKSKQDNPAMWQEEFHVGDAIEIKMVSQGGVKPMGDGIQQETEKVRGVVLGIVNRGLSSSVIIRDVVFGQVIERKIPLHSPMIQEMKILERDFVYKGKRKVKRAKLYFLRDRNPLLTKVSKY